MESGEKEGIMNGEQPFVLYATRHIKTKLSAKRTTFWRAFSLSFRPFESSQEEGIYRLEIRSGCSRNAHGSFQQRSRRKPRGEHGQKLKHLSAEFLDQFMKDQRYDWRRSAGHHTVFCHKLGVDDCR